MLRLAAGRTPLEILRGLAAGEVRAEDVSASERQMCVEVLRDQGQTMAQVAGVLRVSRATVARDERRVAERYAQIATSVSPALRAVRLEHTADKVKSKATEAKDWALVWRVEKELQHELNLLLKENEAIDDRGAAAGRLYLDQLDPKAKQLLLEEVEKELARRGET